jgi:hypothetical protein
MTPLEKRLRAMCGIVRMVHARTDVTLMHSAFPAAAISRAARAWLAAPTGCVQMAFTASTNSASPDSIAPSID